MDRLPQITVCICTYRRPALLSRLLLDLAVQETEDAFDYSIVVVDNDKAQSAHLAVESFARRSTIALGYHVEPHQNIALARNKTVANADADLLAFIDDDEFPPKRWLLTLYRALAHYRCDGVLGPVLPSFEQAPPEWVRKARLFERPSHPTGQVLDWKNARTGNALLRSALFSVNQNWFDPQFGSGGEDRDFFKRMIDNGRVFVWCDEAYVYETISPNRWKRTVLVKRALLRGKMALNATNARWSSILKSALAFLLYAATLPVLFFVAHHLFMTHVIKACDHLGKVLAFLRLDLVKEKYVSG
jgi:succinoglycan biosynthesis protein ExoM